MENRETPPLPAGSPLPLRPHHGMCLGFFTGHGYSGAFTEHMARVRRGLWENPGRPVVLRRGADVLCAACPNNLGGACRTAEKADRYDERVLEACGLSFGQTMAWRAFRRAVAEKILARPGARETICADCWWNPLCQQQDVEKSVESVKNFPETTFCIIPGDDPRDEKGEKTK